jgi:hypothetical protein
LRILYAPTRDIRDIVPLSEFRFAKERSMSALRERRISSETVSNVLSAVLMLPFGLGTLFGVALLLQQVLV